MARSDISFRLIKAVSQFSALRALLLEGAPRKVVQGKLVEARVTLRLVRRDLARIAEPLELRKDTRSTEIFLAISHLVGRINTQLKVLDKGIELLLTPAELSQKLRLGRASDRVIERRLEEAKMEYQVIVIHLSQYVNAVIKEIAMIRSDCLKAGFISE